MQPILVNPRQKLYASCDKWDWWQVKAKIDMIWWQLDWSDARILKTYHIECLFTVFIGEWKLVEVFLRWLQMFQKIWGSNSSNLRHVRDKTAETCITCTFPLSGGELKSKFLAKNAKTKWLVRPNIRVKMTRQQSDIVLKLIQSCWQNRQCNKCWSFTKGCQIEK